MAHSINIITRIAAEIHAIVSRVGATPAHVPRQAETNSQGAAARAKIPNNVPVEFARQALNTSPRTK